MSQDPTKLKGWQIVSIFVGVVVVWILGWLVPWSVIGTPEKSGQLGDTFGAVNALFSGLAFAGLIVTLIMQREELALQRHEMEQMRDQYTRTADAQEASEKILLDQVQATLSSAKIQALAAFVRIHIAKGTHGTAMHSPNPQEPALDVVVERLNWALGEADNLALSSFTARHKGVEVLGEP